MRRSREIKAFFDVGAFVGGPFWGSSAVIITPPASITVPYLTRVCVPVLHLTVAKVWASYVVVRHNGRTE